ncbi:hypothetical protein GCM10010361_66960 [Streptomyces olivaceiscleroticus]|uniref:Potassium-transporting ATPase subunit F n=1 Tax=Streptomyces olivaceiscleroticus TaxID=68245 RepID=A0ABN1BA13_9ACTN
MRQARATRKCQYSARLRIGSASRGVVFSRRGFAHVVWTPCPGTWRSWSTVTVENVVGLVIAMCLVGYLVLACVFRDRF